MDRLHARRALTLLLTAPAVAAALAAVGPAVAVASAAPPRDQVLWFWEWSDGSLARSRELDESRYGTWAELPWLDVASMPAARGNRVALEVRVGGRWLTEDVTTTDADGRARLLLNPYCAHGDWCDERTEYRLVAAGVQAPLQVRFTPRASPP